MNSRVPIQAAAILAGPGFLVRVGPAGALQAEMGDERYTVESFFSYPGVTIGLNALGLQRHGETGWSPQVTQVGPEQLRLEAAGASYRLVRTMTHPGPSNRHRRHPRQYRVGGCGHSHQPSHYPQRRPPGAAGGRGT